MNLPETGRRTLGAAGTAPGPLGALPLVATAAVIGSLSGWSARPAAVIAFAFAGVGVALVVLAARQRSTAATLVATVLVFAGAAGIHRAGLAGGPLAELAATGGTRAVAGRVVTEPRRAEHGWWAVVRLHELDGARTRERALVRGDGPLPVLGSVWVGDASAAPLGEDGFDAYLRRLHVVAELSPATWRQVEPPGPGARASEHVRAQVRAAAARGLPAGPAGLAVGLVTGDTRLLPPDDEEAMRAVGLSHLTAVSGSNLAIVVAAVAGASAIVGLGARGRRRAIAGSILAFAFLTRFEPSVLRAGAMVALVLLADARGVGRDARHALAGGILLLLAIDPALAGSLGLLLSATATAGVLLVAPRIRERLRRLPDRVAQLLALTIGAQLAVAPLLLVTVGEVPLASVPANLIAVPAAGVASVLVGAGALLAIVSVGAGAAVMALAHPALWAVLAIAGALRARGGVVSLVRPTTVLLLTLGVLWCAARRGSRLRRTAGAAVALALVASFLPGLGGRVRSLTVTAIDVGQGDAILLESPQATVLVDAGGDDRAARWLRAHGRRDLDLVVVSHPHADHVDGIPQVVHDSRVGALWYRAVPTELASVAELERLVVERDIPVVAPVSGQTATLADLAIEVLGPPPERPYRWTDSEPNDTSLVLRISWRGRGVLLTGDAEVPAQEDLLRDPTRLRAAVLKVPHHGGGTTDPAFIAATGARIALVSVGADNRYGHPHPRTVAALEALGAEIRRTDLEGTVREEVPAIGSEFAPDRVPPPRPAVSRPSLRSSHGRPRLPHRRRRRPPAPPRARARPRGTHRGRSRAPGRDPRRLGDRAPP